MAPRGGVAIRATSSAPSATQSTCTKNGHTVPTAKRNAPTGGPTSWLVVRNPACSRALPTPRSSRGTSIGSSVPLAVSANTSATPNRNVVTSTTVTSTQPVTMLTHRTATTRARNRSATTTSSRRSTRSAIAPAHSPNSSHGSRWSTAAMATSTGLRVCEATSSGPAARPIPSPRFDAHDEASSHRNPAPMRGGATTSRMRPTRSRTYPPDAVSSPEIRPPPARHPAPLRPIRRAGPLLRRMGTRPVSAGRIRVSFSATPHGRRRAHHGSGGSPPRERPSGVWPGTRQVDDHPPAGGERHRRN